MTTRSSLGLGALVFVLGVPAVACDKATPKKVSVSVLVILASEKDDFVEKKLECIGKEMTKKHPKLKGFRSVDLKSRSVTIGTEETFDLTDDERATIVIKEAADKTDRVRLKVGPPLMSEITYSTPCGKFLPILTPVKTKTGEHVVIAIRVRPCNGGK